MQALAGIIREALIVAAVLCFPVLIVATAVGTIVAVVQAATQVQEQTLTLLPKIAAVGLMVAMCGGFALHLCASLFAHAISAVPAIVRGS
jgi:flagellar biosynthetic protein FliQ